MPRLRCGRCYPGWPGCSSRSSRPACAPIPGRPGDPEAGPLPRAGLIKVAGSFHHLDAHARQTMIAAAEAHHATGAPIGVHHELGTAALDVADLLCGQLQVSADRVILGHLNRLPDPYLQWQTAETGAYLAFDGPSRANHADRLAAARVPGRTRPPRPRGPDPHRRRHHHGRGPGLDRRRAPACRTCSGCCGPGWPPSSATRWRRSSSCATPPALSAGPEVSSPPTWPAAGRRSAPNWSRTSCR